MKASAFAVASALAGGASAQSLPTGFNPTPGTATMSTPTSSSMVVNQTAARTIIDWTSFNIANGNSLTFSQPSASAVAVNRVGAGAGQSAIDGILSANGHVMILNPNGVLFGPTASVNVGGLIASTGNIDANPFLSGGAFAITGATAGSVSNAGAITIAGAGLAAFVAPSVANSGTINAASGRITLAGAQAATVSLNGGLYELAVTQGVANPSVSNLGTLSAPGGTIALSALDAANVVSGVINLEGIQQATRIEVNGGQVTLKSDLNATTVAGSSSTIDVSSLGKIQDGIDIAATGAHVNVAAGTYAEQLSVGKSISLAGAGANQTTIAPTSLAADADAMRNILTVRGAGTDAEVSGLTFKGPVPAITAGIFVRDGANARIHDNKLVDMRESATLSGNQRGIGIFVGRASINTSGTAVIENNQIIHYQKGGIVVDGPASQATIRGNTVTGEGPASVIAQNGIQVSRGARATLSGNTVSGNAYTGISPDPDDFAAGILYFVSDPYLGQGAITVDATNGITANQVGIWTNEALVLPTISLSGATGNTRNAVAFFNGGYAGQGPLLQYPAWSASASAVVNPGTFSGAQSGDIRDVSGTLYVSGWSGFSAIQPAINAVAPGATVNVAAGTFTQTGTLNVNKSITLAGAGEASTTIDSRGVTASGGAYGILVNADNVTLRDFTLYGPALDAGSAYGIKVQPAGSAASSRLNNFSISNVTSRGAGRAELDLNGVKGATIDHVTANGAPVGNDAGTTKGAGIQVTDSANVTIRNSTTRNNLWGGIALYQSNRFFDQQTSNISVESNNVLTESLPLYTQDESASKNFGALSLQGFNYAVKNSDSPSTNDQYTWLQYTLGGAYDFAVNVAQPGKSSIQGWNVSAPDHNFYVGVGHLSAGGTRAMSVQSAVDAAVAGDTVNAGSMSFAEDVVVSAPRNFAFSGTTLHSLTVNSGAAGSGIGGTVSADGATGFVFGAPIAVTSDASLSTIGNRNISFSSTIDGAHALSLQAGTGGITLGGAVGSTTPLASLTVSASTIAAQSVSTVGNQSYDGALTLNGASYTASNGAFSALGATTLGANTTLDASGGISFAGTIDGARALSLSAGTGVITLGGNTGSTTSLSSLTANASAIAAQSVSTVGNQTYSGALALNGATYTASNGGFSVTGAATLGANTIIDTSGGNKNISFSTTINGARTLSLQAGAGSLALGGNVGGTAALTSLAANGSTIAVQNVSTLGNQAYTGALTLNGTSYTAANGAFSAVGATTLGGSTTVDTSGGNRNISFSSTIDGARALSLQAGTGAVALGGNVGGTAPLTSLTANGSTIAARSVSTAGNQTYSGALTLNGASYTASNGAFNANGATTLGTDTTVDTSGGSKSISFAGAIDGARALSLQSGTGTITLAGHVGATTPLASLTAHGSTIAAQNVSTLGNQGYTGALTLNGASYAASNGAFSALGATTLGANTTVDTSAGISFAGTIDGARTLALQAGSGAITLTGNVGGATPLTSLTASGSTIAAQNVATIANQAYTGALTLNGASYIASNGAFSAVGATTLGANTTVDTSIGNKNISFSSTIDGARSLSLQAGTGTITLGGNAGATLPLASLTANGGLVVVHDVFTVGNQSYSGALMLNGTTYTTSNGSFTANSATTLSADTTVDTSAGNKDIAFNGDIRTVGGNPYALSLDAGSGNITLTSGGTPDAPLGTLSSASGNFTLLGTLWVSGFGIDALGVVALSDHSLHAVGSGTSDAISAGSGITGTASSAGDVALQSGGDVAANVSATNIAINAASVSGTASATGDVAIQSSSNVSATISGNNVAINAVSGVTGKTSAVNDVSIESGGNVTASISANKIVISADQVNATVNSPSAVEVHSPAPVNLSGSAPTLLVDAPGGSISGTFGQVSNTGGALLEVNGVPQAPDMLSASASPSRLLPSENTITGNAAGNPRVSAPALVPVVAGAGTLRASPADAADLLQSGASVEIDLSPRRERD